jgi:hypothetical protein
LKRRLGWRIWASHGVNGVLDALGFCMQSLTGSTFFELANLLYSRAISIAFLDKPLVSLLQPLRSGPRGGAVSFLISIKSGR